jgi:hypothetical protein
VKHRGSRFVKATDFSVGYQSAWVPDTTTSGVMENSGRIENSDLGHIGLFS